MELIKKMYAMLRAIEARQNALEDNQDAQAVALRAIAKQTGSKVKVKRPMTAKPAPEPAPEPTPEPTPEPSPEGG